MMINRHRWYNRLHDPATHQENGPTEQLIIATDKSYIDDNKDEQFVKSYAWFDSIDAFVNWKTRSLKEYCETNRTYCSNFYEIIRGNGPQKAYFDIDIEESVCKNPHEKLTKVIQNLVKSILEEALEWGGIMLSLEDDIIVTDSSYIYQFDCSMALGKKASSHVIVDNVYFNNYLEAKAFYERVILRMSMSNLYPEGTTIQHIIDDPNLPRYVDSKVYGKNQQLRLLLSCKIFKYNFKMIKPIWKYYKRTITSNLSKDSYGIDPVVWIHRRCLISRITNPDNVRWYKNPSPSIPKQLTIKSSNSSYEAIEDDVAKEAYALFMKTHPDMKASLRRGLSRDNVIVLKRLRKGYCHKCQREHDNNNCFLTVHIIKDTYNVYLGCQAASSNPSLFIGTLEVEPLNTDDDILESPFNPFKVRLLDLPPSNPSKVRGVLPSSNLSKPSKVRGILPPLGGINKLKVN